VECKLLVTDNYGVASVVAALVANYVVDSVAEKVGCFTFSFVAPLGSD
jgi:hypothetical protein